MISRMSLFSLVAVALCVASKDLHSATAFAPSSSPRHSSSPSPPTSTMLQEKKNGFLQGFQDFFEELDAFIDDASARRLGNGAAFYGKRKSNFYGEKDVMRKLDRSVQDIAEDYQGPSSSGYFKWMPDEDGQMRPVTRMKEKSLDNPRLFDKKE